MRQLCRSLDGLPLAIELAAARTRTLSIQEIARRLDDRFAILHDPTSRRPERRRALRATIQWSYDLLFPDDQRGLWALSTFVGGAPLTGLEAVLAALDVPATNAVDVVSRLVNRSLVIVDDSDADRPRYRLLDSIRAFADGELRRAGGTERAAGAHAEWYATAAVGSTDGVRSARQAEHLRFARTERANIDAALAWWLTRDRGARPRPGDRLRVGVDRPRRQPRRPAAADGARRRRRHGSRRRRVPRRCCCSDGSRRRSATSNRPDSTSSRRSSWPPVSTTSSCKPAGTTTWPTSCRTTVSSPRASCSPTGAGRSTPISTGRGTRRRTSCSPCAPRRPPATSSAPSPPTSASSGGSVSSTIRGSTCATRRWSASWPVCSVATPTPSPTSSVLRRHRIASGSGRPRPTSWPASAGR